MSDSETKTTKHKKEKLSQDLHFETFWKAYPRKVKKVHARQKWITKKCDPLIEQIMANLQARLAGEWRYTDIEFIPHPTTYLNQQRWEDELIDMENNQHGQPKPTEQRGAGFSVFAALERIKNKNNP